MAENVKNLKKIQQIVAHKGGGTILSYDFSTLEVRIFSAISCDTTLRDVLLSGADLHCNTARNIFPELKGMSDKEIKEHHSGLRSKAKSTMFGLLYGKSAYNFSKEWGCTVEEAQETIDKMMGAYPGIKTYVEYQHKFAREHGYIVDVFGCTRPLPDAMLPDTKSNRKLLNHAMNASQNSGIQCFVGDTKIPLLDGSVVEIQNLVNNFENKYVLSCCNDGKIIPGKIINAFKSGETDTVCKVTLDSGEIITCTPEHQFMLRNGTYKHAIDLKNNESLMPCYTKNDKLRYKYVKRNEAVTSVEVIKLPNKISVYDIEVENNENTHNFALEAGVFVHNSSASRMAWIAGTHIAEEMLMHDLQSVMIGGVHDSTYLDIYPGELIPVFKICQFHAGTVPNVIYDWMNGNKMFIDFGLGQSWGREMDIKSFEEKDGKFILNIKGGNCNWDYLKRELDEAYDYKILEMKEGDPIPPEEREELPIEVPTQLISLKLEFEDPCPNMDFKSKYFVGNGFYGKREE